MAQCKAGVETPDGQLWCCVFEEHHQGSHETAGVVFWFDTPKEKFASYAAKRNGST